MINENEYEHYFLEGIETAKDNYGDEEMAMMFMEKFINLTYIEDNALKDCVETFKKKEWKEFRENIHKIKGRLKFILKYIVRK